jgi:hypothetical protein
MDLMMYKMTDLIHRVFCFGLVFASFSLWAAQKNPDGFNTPEGLEIEQFGDNDRYICVASKKTCTAADIGFDDQGRLKLEGRIEEVKYKSPNAGERVPGLLLQRNYERVVQQMGGALGCGHGWARRKAWMDETSAVVGPWATA